jgi:hypothetical protein
VRTLARWLDDSLRLPGTKRRIGLDPILGLVPVVGDTVGLLLSGYIVFEARRLGVPRSLLGRMLANVAIETLVGSIPLLGDAFDAGWKANLRNVALLEGHVLPPAERSVSVPGSAGNESIVVVALAAISAVLLAVIVWMVST